MEENSHERNNNDDDDANNNRKKITKEKAHNNVNVKKALQEAFDLKENERAQAERQCTIA